MTRTDIIAADAEYVALLDAHGAESLKEVIADDWGYDDTGDYEDYERSAAWSYAFERDDDMRCGGTFSELLHGSM